MDYSNSINLIGMKQLQAALKIRSRQTIYKMLARGELPPPCIVDIRGLRWRESDLADWVRGLKTRH